MPCSFDRDNTSSSSSTRTDSTSARIAGDVVDRPIKAPTTGNGVRPKYRPQFYRYTYTYLPLLASVAACRKFVSRGYVGCGCRFVVLCLQYFKLVRRRPFKRLG
ncbi:hypothetical protein ACS0PU_003717 [Formica fusca]